MCYPSDEFADGTQPSALGDLGVDLLALSDIVDEEAELALIVFFNAQGDECDGVMAFSSLVVLFSFEDVILVHALVEPLSPEIYDVGGKW
jgi:hypothetical protein